ncbi:hypothetical protein BDV96DRAFT_638377 [Lophiotrema nucula]|uniref:Uncharacterized protein n=1 Tax=Lophiotrema nucula TaxID=690887 RepID=A0A6A5YH84_9PLEO|nr:hypothetical protein BDV96DRAFT_638377 [Lophiotrema nucula]
MYFGQRAWPLLRVGNHRLAAQVLDVYYKMNKFVIEIQVSDKEMRQGKFTLVPKASCASLIRHLEVRATYYLYTKWATIMQIMLPGRKESVQPKDLAPRSPPAYDGARAAKLFPIGVDPWYLGNGWQATFRELHDLSIVLIHKADEGCRDHIEKQLPQVFKDKILRFHPKEVKIVLKSLGLCCMRYANQNTPCTSVPDKDITEWFENPEDFIETVDTEDENSDDDDLPDLLDISFYEGP